MISWINWLLRRRRTERKASDARTVAPVAAAETIRTRPLFPPQSVAKAARPPPSQPGVPAASPTSANVPLQPVVPNGLLRRQVLLIGQSHVQAVMLASRQPELCPGLKFDIRDLQLLRAETPYLVNLDHRWQYNPILDEEVRAKLDEVNPDLVVFMLEGQQAAAWGYGQPDRRFDLVIPGEPYVRSWEGELMPYDLAVATFKNRLVHIDDFLRRLSKIVTVPTVAVLPPPVVEDNIYLSSHPSIQHLLTDAGLPPAEWRRRIRKANVDAFAAVYRDHGIPVIGPPAVVFDQTGFLAQPYVHDAFHGNARYGAEVIRQIDATLNAR